MGRMVADVLYTQIVRPASPRRPLTFASGSIVKNLEIYQSDEIVKKKFSTQSIKK